MEALTYEDWLLLDMHVNIYGRESYLLLVLNQLKKNLKK